MKIELLNNLFQLLKTYFNHIRQMLSPHTPVHLPFFMIHCPTECLILTDLSYSTTSTSPTLPSPKSPHSSSKYLFHLSISPVEPVNLITPTSTHPLCYLPPSFSPTLPNLSSVLVLPIPPPHQVPYSKEKCLRHWSFHSFSSFHHHLSFCVPV